MFSGLGAVFSLLTIGSAALSQATDPFADARQTRASCFDELIRIFMERYEGEGFALLPPRVEDDAFILRVVLDNENIVRSESLMRALKNPHLRRTLAQLRFGYEHQRDRIPLLDVVGYDLQGRMIEEVTSYEDWEQHVFEMPDVSSLLFHMRIFEERHFHRFVFLPTILSGGLASHIGWLKAISRREFPVATKGDIFQHDYHDHLLAFIFMPASLANALAQSITYLLQVYEDETSSTFIKNLTKAHLERIAYRIEDASAKLQSAIADLRPNFFRWRNRRAQQRRVEEVLKYFAMIDLYPRELSALEVQRVLRSHVQEAVRNGSVPASQAGSTRLYQNVLEEPEFYRFSHVTIPQASTHLISLLLGRKRIY